jgi:hypothetical protein
MPPKRRKKKSEVRNEKKCRQRDGKETCNEFFCFQISFEAESGWVRVELLQPEEIVGKNSCGNVVRLEKGDGSDDERRIRKLMRMEKKSGTNGCTHG